SDLFRCMGIPPDAGVCCVSYSVPRKNFLSSGGIVFQHNSTTRVSTIIIGGGQAGLAMGYHLAQRGLPFVILDANPRVGDAWRNRWDSLRLFSPASYDG